MTGPDDKAPYFKNLDALEGDGTGRDDTTFLPESQLDSRYLIVENSSYIAVACPGPAVDLTVTQGSGSTSSFTCSGSRYFLSRPSAFTCSSWRWPCR